MNTEQSFKFCEQLTKKHYENFPVGSILVPKKLRKHFYSIYAFARTADDFADEGNAAPEQKLKLLSDFRAKLETTFNGVKIPNEPIFLALSETIKTLNLPEEPFLNLIKAFEMDTTFSEFQTREEEYFYCKHSANPVGKLILCLFSSSNAENDLLSDKICTGLQIANFLQDISVDWQKDRVYIPKEVYRKFGLARKSFGNDEKPQDFAKMIEFEVGSTKKLLLEGSELISKTKGRLNLELRFIVAGGLVILDKILENKDFIRTKRPKLQAKDKLKILKKLLAFR
ncbi:squalene synthase HpnC [bacterium]|nr:squalene synthase HpnC [bacterium]